MEEVSLRAVEPEDIEFLYQWENDTSIWHLSNTLEPFSRYVLTKYIESAHLDIFQTRQLRLMIDLKTDNQNNTTIGAIDLFDFDPHNQRAGVGILIGDNSRRGKGYATKALEMLIDYAFKTLHLNQLYCNINEDNDKSLKLFQNLGFQVCGRKKLWNKLPGRYTDEFMLQLLNC